MGLSSGDAHDTRFDVNNILESNIQPVQSPVTVCG